MARCHAPSSRTVSFMGSCEDFYPHKTFLTDLPHRAGKPCRAVSLSVSAAEEGKPRREGPGEKESIFKQSLVVKRRPHGGGHKLKAGTGKFSPTPQVLASCSSTLSMPLSSLPLLSLSASTCAPQNGAHQVSTQQITQPHCLPQGRAREPQLGAASCGP